MIDTVLFDLDGTLLPFRQDDFVKAYFSEIGKVFAKLGFDPQRAVAAVWAGTKAMVANDGAMTNSGRFWETFAKALEVPQGRLKEVEDACDAFYSNEFDRVRAVIAPTEIPKRMVRGLAKRGYTLVLATNPLFPRCAVQTRLNWIGLDAGDFSLVTDYSNSFYCKPNPKYYEEIFKKTDKIPGQCLMAGNNAKEDMCAGTLGAATFLVTDYPEEPDGGYPADRQGTLAELEEYLSSL
ncbi:MAG: HAD family hydrolase [Oscillospiraceae bacterium]|jgi:FMN phosphatase YigB (HAD superfamily)|nr:HAD family hydrolase [Oscillospiraceae bacterium]